MICGVGAKVLETIVFEGGTLWRAVFYSVFECFFFFFLQGPVGTTAFYEGCKLGLFLWGVKTILRRYPDTE